MRRTMLIAAGFAATMTIMAAGPALAGYGALAYDESTGKYGLSSNEETQTKADDVATKECGGDKCKIVFRTAAKQCGAIAMVGEAKGPNPAWGAGKHGNRAQAELAAVTNCQKHTKSQCKIRSVECNR
jgi:uncharacterized protein DUF4189